MGRRKTRKPSVSREQYGKKQTIISFLPYDRPGCICIPLVKAEKARLSQMLPKQRLEEQNKKRRVVCPRITEAGFKKYKIICRRCKEVVGFVHSKDKKLSDWCNFHYVSRTDGKRWYGCFSPNISPIDGSLGIECACGNDTRDFRANTNLGPKEKERKIKETMKGREFGKRNSKFILKEVENG